MSSLSCLRTRPFIKRIPPEVDRLRRVRSSCNLLRVLSWTRSRDRFRSVISLSLERLHLRHHLALPQWQDLRVVGDLLLDYFRIQVLAFGLEEVSIAALFRKVLLELLQGDVVTRDFSPIGKLLIAETEHNGGEISGVLPRLLQSGLV